MAASQFTFSGERDPLILFTIIGERALGFRLAALEAGAAAQRGTLIHFPIIFKNISQL